jgi:hypothetical protein
MVDALLYPHKLRCVWVHDGCRSSLVRAHELSHVATRPHHPIRQDLVNAAAIDVDHFKSPSTSVNVLAGLRQMLELGASTNPATVS